MRMETDQDTRSSLNCWKPEHSVITGRASSAIYLLLKHLKETGACRNMTYMAPANVCYAALYPAVYAGWSVRLIDVDPVTGNITAESLQKSLEEKGIPDVLLAAHMYGQPIEDFERIAGICHSHQIIILEDCASAMGSKADYPLGTTGDYTIFSTGYAKNIEVGYGGILGSVNDPLDWVEPAQNDLPVYSDSMKKTETLFSRLYRTLRNNRDDYLDRAVYEAMLRASKHLFLFRLDEGQKRVVEESLRHLPNVVSRKRELFLKTGKLLKQAVDSQWRNRMKIYPYSSQAVPWRFSLLLDPQIRPAFIQECLKRGLPVSDWYPSTAPMIADFGRYPGAEEHASRIVNFPLEEKALDDLCSQINDILKTAAGVTQ